MAVPERKTGYSTVFPVSVVVGEALLDYLQHGHPTTSDRRVFLRAVAPCEPTSAAEVSAGFTPAMSASFLCRRLFAALVPGGCVPVDATLEPLEG
ncbi:hypothetical protein [Arthrobacter cryoconiti]|uniref:Uncharacterized protein n=1 Tax=Arthrobacter cryoconiti TaxID=748907 RepID=A0ABV8R5B2_9MICC|nr:hypothetical protein [Arthrobacter cryoconiti]MCC9069403.1 hypothetical protein [Arthrobacter cryoconiti]